MGEFTVRVLQNGVVTELEGEAGISLLELFVKHDIYISAACGGAGKCGKCKVHFLEGTTEITTDDRVCLTEEELQEGWRLSCLAYPDKDCVVEILSSDESDFDVVSEYQAQKKNTDGATESAYDIAIDIGSTTIAVNLIGQDTKEVCQTFTTINRQRAYGADVISRIQASVDGKGKELQESIQRDLLIGIREVIREEGIDASLVQRIAIAGNTTMGHLLMGYSCETLGVFPFTPVNIDTIHTTGKELFAGAEVSVAGLEDVQVVLLPGISTYVGADISAGMLFCEMDRSEGPCLLVDLGTNGEMAIGKAGHYMVTSTAAGPAFEGGNISCGMGAVKGSICGVTIEDEQAQVETIGDKPAIGLCGTGVLETVYELLRNELIDETGVLEEDYFDDGFELAKTPDGEPITFTQKDVREIQLAKSAVRAGLETLLIRYGVSYDQVEKVYLAGGFGYRIDLEKSIGIGLLPEELREKIVAVGNSSLGGAGKYLMEADAPERMEKMMGECEEIALSTDKDFIQFYTDYMFFE